MKFCLTGILIALSLVAIAGGQLSRAYVIPPAPEPERSLFKRSLCNTFGGCGAKRSMQLSFNNGRQTFGDSNESDGKTEPWSMSRRETQLELITEILDDLIDYLKTSEKYKQGKYIVVVAKPAELSTGQAANGLQMNTLDVQELQQAARHYMNKDK